MNATGSFVSLNSAKLRKDNLSTGDWNTLTVKKKKMSATNSPPSVDYSIKFNYYHRTAVLASDSKLTIMCLSSLEE